MATGYVLLKVEYDSERYDLQGITHRMEGGQGCVAISVLQVDAPDAVQSDSPYIGY